MHYIISYSSTPKVSMAQTKAQKARSSSSKTTSRSAAMKFRPWQYRILGW